VNTDERLGALETKMADLERKLSLLVQFAKLHPAGRAMLKMMGIA
jgi:hypothetical protein